MTQKDTDSRSGYHRESYDDSSGEAQRRIPPIEKPHSHLLVLDSAPRRARPRGFVPGGASLELAMSEASAATSGRTVGGCASHFLRLLLDSPPTSRALDPSSQTQDVGGQRSAPRANPREVDSGPDRPPFLVVPIPRQHMHPRRQPSRIELSHATP